ncbi:MAG: hypothetical protein E3J87_02310 [Candidatus Cloacimonadota bacterium]|nr:MAG: hypothetical protein E3J87_02310 [Candidatus Cloacimonadota bacterium]
MLVQKRGEQTKTKRILFDKFCFFLVYFLLINIFCFGCHKNPTGDGENYDSRNVSRNSGGAGAPSMCIDNNGTVHLVWMDDTPGNWEIFYSFKTASGRWATPANISNTDSASYGPDIVSDPLNKIHVVWDEWVAEHNPEILYIEKDWLGEWSDTVNISQTETGDVMPDIDSDSYGTLYVVWMDGLGMGFCQKEDNSWSTPEIFSPHSDLNPSCTVSNDGILYVVGESHIPTGNREIYFYIRNKNRNWTEPRNLSNSPDYYSYLPEIVCDDQGNVFASWCESIQGYSDIFFSVCSLSGNWSDPENISNTPLVSSFWISMDIDISGKIHLVNMEETGVDYDVIYKVRDVNGDWTDSENISQTDELSAAPCVRVSDGMIHIAWIEGSPGKGDVYYVEK